MPFFNMCQKGTSFDGRITFFMQKKISEVAFQDKVPQSRKRDDGFFLLASRAYIYMHAEGDADDNDSWREQRKRMDGYIL